uniref:RING-type E3 ubiquitin transferase n=1 Tax=Anthurium amnicola TaxID=1678845 RepID=A0A1D1Y562_9ARAE
MSTRELLILQPENLKFHFQLMKQLDCILRLTNTTNEYVAFKVLTTNTSKYCVKPNMGMVPPRLACDTIVTMREQETTPTGVVSKDKFKVKCFMTAPHSTVKDVRTDMFNEGSGNIMEEYKLKVFYELPGHLQPPAPKVDILTKVRHPNLVNLMGACFSPEPCLVYEFLPNGSLEDRLSCKDNTPPLSWQARIHIITEICSALIFLHSYKPHSVVHGDLKPSNILLDANLVSKLSDFGICRLLTQSSTTTKLHHTEPKGTFPYIDQEFGYTGELTSSSDTYSFGVIILQLLTGRPALGVIKAVQDALTSENLHNILDESAGEWPFLQARRLARLGVECCKMSRRNRPRLETEVWRVLEPMVRASSLVSSSFQLGQDNDSHAPSYFMCPILQEVMNDPLVAADGFTYEAEAIKGWFDSGHNTSPLTNLELPHHELLPNRALRSVIQEWLQQEQHHQ